jgi:hypothetical protein
MLMHGIKVKCGAEKSDDRKIILDGVTVFG